MNVILCKKNHKYDNAMFKNPYVHTEKNFLVQIEHFNKSFHN